MPSSDEIALERRENIRRRIGVVDERQRFRALRFGQTDEIDDALEADRESDGRNIASEEAPDHAVVAAAAPDGAARAGVSDLEDRTGVVAHSAHECGIEAHRHAVGQDTVERGPELREVLHSGIESWIVRADR